MSLRDKIRNAQDIQSELIEVDVWGSAVVEVRSMSSKQRSHMLRESMNDKGELDFESMYPQLLVACCYDPDTNALLFERDDMEWLHDKNAGAVEKLAQAAMRLSGLTRESSDEGKGASSKNLDSASD